MTKVMIRFLHRYPWIVSFCILALLIIPAARMHELWGDEAETALFARNILKYGVPKGWDGTNIMGINNAVVLDKNLVNHTSPWAQYYMVAASFALFGQSSFTARIPSIFLSLLSIPMLYFLAMKLTGNKRIAFLTTLIASLSVQGILFAYQARYYQLTNISGILFLWASVSLLDRRMWPRWVFILSGVVFFYANYVSWSAFYVATFVGVSFFMLMTKGKLGFIDFLKRFFLLSILIGAATVPWVAIFQPFESRGSIGFLPIGETVSLFWYFATGAWRPFHTAAVLPLGLVVLLAGVFAYETIKKAVNPAFLLILGLPIVYLTGMTIVATIANVDTIFTHPRYTTVALPLFYLLVAYGIATIITWQRWLGVAILMLYLFTNALTLQRFQSYQWELMREITRPYQTPDKVVADYLAANARDGDTAFVNLDRDHEPLIFHLGTKIRFVNRVSLINTRIFPRNRSIIPRYVYDFREAPDWVIMYSKRGVDGTFLTFDWRELWPEMDLERNYEEVTLPVFFSDLSRPEIEFRSFEEVKPSEGDMVYIYRKRSNKQ